MLLFAVSIFLSAFLLFQVQPMIGKAILPWFGGTPAVWSTLLLVFQVLLTGGYAYAAWLARRTRTQTRIHILFLLFGILLIGIRGVLGGSPVLPVMSAISLNLDAPVLEIVIALLLSAGLPFFILSSNGPLIQAWFSRLHPGRAYAPLYALSNAGSLLGLLTYPFWIEPNLPLREQGGIWSIGFILFGILTGWIVYRTGSTALPTQAESIPEPINRGHRPSRALILLWIILSATGSLFLLSVTNQISQEVAVIPFLWILPLAIYLISFILTFSGDRGYKRKFHAWMFILSAGLTLFVLLNATRLHISWQILAYSLLLFEACMLCHGELYRLRPPAEYLTTFYLMVSIGGALGGTFVSLLAPLIFNGYWEFFVGLALTMAILLSIFRSSQDVPVRARFALTVFFLVTIMLAILSTYFSGALYAKRNFYGVIRVRALIPEGSNEPANIMTHGITVHGLQFIHPELRHLPTTYYVPDAGAGLAITNHPRHGPGLRVGLLGAGVGTLTVYGQPADTYRLYEINPVVVELAEGQGGYFSFVSDSLAEVIMVPGDARISLERELDEGHWQNFDVLVLDTFSSDSVPVHLVTQEAFGLYLSQLAPDGIIAAHITNLHLDLQPVFWQLAQHYNLSIVRVDYEGDSNGGYASHWILLSPDPNILEIPAIQERSTNLTGYSTDIQLWTDDYSNLFQILK
jgi:hypothetical protein